MSELRDLSENLCAVEDFLRDYPGRNGDDMADLVHEAWRIIDDLADDHQTADPGPQNEEPDNQYFGRVRDMSGLGTGTAKDDEIKTAIGESKSADKPLLTELWLRLKALESAAKPASK